MHLGRLAGVAALAGAGRSRGSFPVAVPPAGPGPERAVRAVGAAERPTAARGAGARGGAQRPSRARAAGVSRLTRSSGSGVTIAWQGGGLRRCKTEPFQLSLTGAIT